MNMNMNNSSDSMSNNRMPTTNMPMMSFHSAIGLDIIWFQPWMPSSVGSTFGACVGLFFLAGFYRFLFALRTSMELKWIAGIRKTKSFGTSNDNCCEERNPLPRFSLKTDMMRGLLEGLQSLVGYLLMLAVMLMNAWFFISIILGLIVGETFFGRFSANGIEMHRAC